MDGRVELRDVEEADLELFWQQEQDPEATRRSKFAPRNRDTFMAHWRTNVLGDPTVRVQTVTVDGEPTGSVVAWWNEPGRRFIGYWFDRRYWGQGVGTTAVTLFLQQEKTRPLHADPFIGNTGSIRLLERCGFRHAGTVRYGQHDHVMLVLDME